MLREMQGFVPAETDSHVCLIIVLTFDRFELFKGVKGVLKGLFFQDLACNMFFQSLCNLHLFRIVDLILVWVGKIDWVELVHIILRGDHKAQKEHAARMKEVFPHLSLMNLEQVDFQTALKQAKTCFFYLSKQAMNKALQSFLDLKLNYLSPGIVVGVGFSFDIQVFTIVSYYTIVLS